MLNPFLTATDSLGMGVGVGGNFMVATGFSYFR